MVTHFDATLGMGGWLNLTQQGLHPVRDIEFLGALPLNVPELLS